MDLSDRAVVQWILPLVILISGISIASTGFIFPQTKTRIEYRYVNHPKGLHSLPQFNSNDDIGGLTRVCEVWANFTPTPTLPFKSGQRFVSDCSIVKTGPKG